MNARQNEMNRTTIADSAVGNERAFSESTSTTAASLPSSTSVAASASQTATMTITQTAAHPDGTSEDVVLPLTLRGRPTVTWDENVEDNEGLGRKSSKRCCIFHKQRDFGESSTDSSDNDSDDSGSSSSSGGGFSTRKKGAKGKKKERRKIARPKQSKVPNSQKYHA
jgi:protein phosphatase 1 regulatory subunit 11